MQRLARLIPALLALAAVAAACGGTDSPAAVTGDPTTAPTAAETTTTEAETTTTEAETTTTEAEVAEGFPVDINGVVVPDLPERIVSLSPSATETLFAIGAGDQVVAVDSFSYFPAEAPVTDLSAFEPNLEAVAAFDPDLVVTSFDPDNLLTDGFAELGVPVLVQFSAFSIEDAYSQMENLGLATGNADGAADLVARMRADIETIAATLPDDAEPVRVYHELDPTFFSATSATFIGEIYALAGVENIADAADPDGEAFGFPQLSAEYILTADPELIVYTDAYGETPDDVIARPGFEALTASTNGDVLEVSSDISSRWGPRIVDFFETIVKALVDVRS